MPKSCDCISPFTLSFNLMMPSLIALAINHSSHQEVSTFGPIFFPNRTVQMQPGSYLHLKSKCPPLSPQCPTSQSGYTVTPLEVALPKILIKLKVFTMWTKPLLCFFNQKLQLLKSCLFPDTHFRRHLWRIWSPCWPSLTSCVVDYLWTFLMFQVHPWAASGRVVGVSPFLLQWAKMCFKCFLF